MANDRYGLILVPISKALNFTNHSSLGLDHELPTWSANQTSGCVEASPDAIPTKLLKCFTLPFTEAQLAEILAYDRRKPVRLSENLGGFESPF